MSTWRAGGTAGLATVVRTIRSAPRPAVAALVVYRRRWKRKLQTADREMLPELEGEIGVAGGEIVPGARGRVVLRGSDWDACNDGPATLTTGSRCVVTGVEGLTLHVRSES